MSQSTVPETWCPAHGHTRVERRIEREPRAPGLTPATLTLWVCPLCAPAETARGTE